MRLKSGDVASIQSLITRLSVEIKSTMTSALELSLYSNGAWSYNEVLNMTAFERDLSVEVLKKRTEA